MEDRLFAPGIVARISLCTLFMLACSASMAQTSFAQQQGIPKGTPCCGGDRGKGKRLQDTAIKRVEPVYPFWARFAGVKGHVVVELTIGEKGDVISARVVWGHDMLRKASIDAAMQWKFNPTLLNGKPVKVMGTITFNFPPQKEKEENKSDKQPR